MSQTRTIPAKKPHGQMIKLRVARRPIKDRADGQGDWCIEVRVRDGRTWRVVARTDVRASESEAAAALLNGLATQ